MPIATPDIYAQMLDRAKQQGFAYPAINVTSSQTLNAALKGFADAESDGIVQVSTGGADYLSGQAVKDMVTGASALAEFAHVVAAKYPMNIALHTDHCPIDKLDAYMRPLVQISADRVKAGREPLFQSHMWDGSAVPLPENLEIAKDLLAKCAEARIIMELEIGVVGGEEDGVVGEINEKLYSTPEDALATAEALGLGERGRYILAATFGNVHGVYKPGHVKLRPSVLKEIQDVGRRQVRQGQAVRPGLPRRLRLGRERDPRGHLLRRGEDERRHRRPVLVHPPGRRPHVRQLRRRAQGGRRGRQQEGLRPALLGQGGRDGHDRPGHPGLPGSELGRHPAEVKANSKSFIPNGPFAPPGSHRGRGRGATVRSG